MSPVGTDLPGDVSATAWGLGIAGALLIGLGKLMQPRLAAMLKSQERRLELLDQERLERIARQEREIEELRADLDAERTEKSEAQARAAVLEAQVAFLKGPPKNSEACDRAS